MNKKLSLGFIGGSIDSAVGITHKIASQMDDRFELVAGAFSKNPDTNKKTAKAWNITPNRTFDDWQIMLQKEKDNLDAVAILTPIALHYEMINKAMDFNLPIICEKTLTDSSKAANELFSRSRKEKKFLVVTYNYTGYPMIRELKNMIEKNILGKIFHIQIEMPQETFMRVDEKGNPTKPQEWRLRDGKEVATISLDLGSHLHHLVHFLTESKPLEVFAQANSFGHFKVIDNISSVSKWENDLECNIWYSKAALGYTNGLKLRIFGNKGSAEWYQMDPEFLHYTNNQGLKTILDRKTNLTSLAKEPQYNRFKAGHSQGFIEAFANYYQDVADCLEAHQKNERHDSVYVFKADIAEEGLRFLEAISKSAKTKTLIRL